MRTAWSRSFSGFTPTYLDPGEDILGYIRFGEKKPEVIIIAESLAELGSDTNEHRRRSTLAHEIGHGRLHAGPFTELVQAKKSGFATEFVRSPGSSRPAFACRAANIRDQERAKAPALSGLAQWERMAEWQANRYMAAVLAPEISRLFNVSRQLASCRLAELFPESADGQGDLFTFQSQPPRAAGF